MRLKPLLSVGIACIVLVLLWVAVAPRVAGHFGWGTAWPRSIPTALSFRGREYLDESSCVRRARTTLDGVRGFRIGSLPVVFGSALPILARSPVPQGGPAATVIVVEARADCYVAYSLQGGP